MSALYIILWICVGIPVYLFIGSRIVIKWVAAFVGIQEVLTATIDKTISRQEMNEAFSRGYKSGLNLFQSNLARRILIIFWPVIVFGQLIPLTVVFIMSFFMNFGRLWIIIIKLLIQPKK